LEADHFFREWGIDASYAGAGGLMPASAPAPSREVTLLQRKGEKIGARLGKTTGWIHRATLKQRLVQGVTGINYSRIDTDGLHVEKNGEVRCIPADTIVICAGQEPLDDLFDPLKAAGISVHIIGGAKLAAELDAERAIYEGACLAADL
jgi:2,4-dienoyl-CoA reductase (NADPH2)